MVFVFPLLGSALMFFVEVNDFARFGFAVSAGLVVSAQLPCPLAHHLGDGLVRVACLSPYVVVIVAIANLVVIGRLCGRAFVLGVSA